MYAVENIFGRKGYQCVVVLQSAGHRCGYVGIPKGHKLYGKNCNTLNSKTALAVHGGFTFAEKNTRYPIANNGFWWVGFDYCGTDADYEAVLTEIPQLKEEVRWFQDEDKKLGVVKKGHIYTMSEVAGECMRLVDQIVKGDY